MVRDVKVIQVQNEIDFFLNDTYLKYSNTDLKLRSFAQYLRNPFFLLILISSAFNNLVCMVAPYLSEHVTHSLSLNAFSVI